MSWHWRASAPARPLSLRASAGYSETNREA